MSAPQTTLAPHAPWPRLADWPMVQDTPAQHALVVAAKSPKAASPRSRTWDARLAKHKAKPNKSEALAILREYLAENPGQCMTQIRLDLDWGHKKLEKLMTDMRPEVLNGYVLKASLIGYCETKKVQA